jgi:hypothetical protein
LIHPFQGEFAKAELRVSKSKFMKLQDVVLMSKAGVLSLQLVVAHLLETAMVL